MFRLIRRRRARRIVLLGALAAAATAYRNRRIAQNERAAGARSTGA